jgi:ribosomal protein S18 acetylase RimI-like enzyme
MEIKLLAPGDEGLLVTAADLFNDVALKAKDAARLLGDPSFVMVVALDASGEMMGRIYGHVLNRIDVSDLFLYEVDVADEYQRRGAATAMLDLLKTFCAKRGYNEMFVLTEVSNDAGNGLYAAAGAVTEDSPANVYVFATPTV